jgi:hypothetical protein
MRTLRDLLQGILDYAGLFPPAALDMPSTVGRFAAARRGGDRWFLGRLIVPLSRLGEFERCAREHLPRGKDAIGVEPWVISALGTPLREGYIERDLEIIEAFNERHADPLDGAATIDTIEWRADSASHVDRALEYLPDHLFPYFEVPPGADARGMVAAMAGLDAGAKIRTGGVTAAEHPATADLAAFISICAAAEVPFKATAGLHHPLRHEAPSVGAKQFGFLGVFLGAALRWHDRIGEEDLAQILEEPSADAFRFDSAAASWRGHSVSHAEILKARERFAHAFGSCSFDEPLEHLRTLRLLPAAPSETAHA